MPKIKEYGPAKLEFQADGESFVAGEPDQFSQQVKSFTESSNSLAYTLNRRKAQEETSDLNAGFAEAAAESTGDIEDGVRDGTIDTPAYMEKLQQRIDKMSDNISTSSGRRTFERNAANLRARAFKQASRGEAAVKGAKVVANVKTEIGSYQASLFTDPSTFNEDHASMMSSVDEHVRQGLPAIEAEKIKVQASKEMAEAAVRGWAQLNPDIAEKKLHAGIFDKYLGEKAGDSKAQMQTYIDTQRSAKLTELNRVDALEKRTQRLKADAFWDRNVKAIANGELDTNAIMNSPSLTGKDKMAMINLVEKNSADGGGRTNPRVKNKILGDIQAGRITDASQISEHVGNGINVKDMVQLNQFLVKTPEGEAMIDGEKNLFEIAKKTIGQKDMSNPWGGTDGSSEYNISRFMFDYQQAKQQMIKDKKNPADLVNPNSKDYFGFKARGYKLSPQDTLKKQADIVAAQTVAKGEKRIKVISPSGQSGTILESEKATYLKQGFRLGN